MAETSDGTKVSGLLRTVTSFMATARKKGQDLKPAVVKKLEFIFR